MVYLPDWEPLADALKRVVAAGATKDEAKLDLCRAVADEKIAMRVRIGADANQHSNEMVLSGPNLPVPSRLFPNDFNWHRSRPSKRLLKRWSIVPHQQQHETVVMFVARAGHLVDRIIELIEVSTSDVTAVLCKKLKPRIPQKVNDETAAIAALVPLLKANHDLKHADALAHCRQRYSVSERGFRSRIWPKARETAGLSPVAPPGRKPKSSR